MAALRILVGIKNRKNILAVDRLEDTTTAKAARRVHHLNKNEN